MAHILATDLLWLLTMLVMSALYAICVICSGKASRQRSRSAMRLLVARFTSRARCQNPSKYSHFPGLISRSQDLTSS